MLPQAREIVVNTPGRAGAPRAGRAAAGRARQRARTRPASPPGPRSRQPPSATRRQAEHRPDRVRDSAIRDCEAVLVGVVNRGRGGPAASRDTGLSVRPEGQQQGSDVGLHPGRPADRAELPVGRADRLDVREGVGALLAERGRCRSNPC